MSRSTAPWSIVVLALASGVAASAAAAEPKRFATPDGLVQLQFPPDWVRNEEQNPFDLQCWSMDERVMTALFMWKREDLAETTRPIEGQEAAPKRRRTDPVRGGDRREPGDAGSRASWSAAPLS